MAKNMSSTPNCTLKGLFNYRLTDYGRGIKMYKGVLLLFAVINE